MYYRQMDTLRNWVTSSILQLLIAAKELKALNKKDPRLIQRTSNIQVLFWCIKYIEEKKNTNTYLTHHTSCRPHGMPNSDLQHFTWYVTVVLLLTQCQCPHFDLLITNAVTNSLQVPTIQNWVFIVHISF